MLHNIPGSMFINLQNPQNYSVGINFIRSSGPALPLKTWKLNGTSKVDEVGPSYMLLTSCMEIKNEYRKLKKLSTGSPCTQAALALLLLIHASVTYVWKTPTERSLWFVHLLSVLDCPHSQDGKNVILFKIRILELCQHILVLLLQYSSIRNSCLHFKIDVKVHTIFSRNPKPTFSKPFTIAAKYNKTTTAGKSGFRNTRNNAIL